MILQTFWNLNIDWEAMFLANMTDALYGDSTENDHIKDNLLPNVGETQTVVLIVLRNW